MPFVPSDYSLLETGHFVGWIGGPSYAQPPAAGGTVSIAVDRPGTPIGLGGGRVTLPADVGSGVDGLCNHAAVTVSRRV